MAFKVQVGPAQIAIHQGQSVLLTEPDGQVNWPSNRGLYFRDTRVISAWAIYANGEPWDLLNGGAIAPHAARIFQTNRAFASEDGPISARTLGLVIGRHIEGRLHEDVDITNNSQHPVRFNLEIAIRADFADIFDVKSARIVRRGRITTSWSDTRPSPAWAATSRRPGARSSPGGRVYGGMRSSPPTPSSRTSPAGLKTSDPALPRKIRPSPGCRHARSTCRWPRRGRPGPMRAWPTTPVSTRTASRSWLARPSAASICWIPSKHAWRSGGAWRPVPILSPG